MRKWHRRISIIFFIPISLMTLTGIVLLQRSNIPSFAPKAQKIAVKEQMKTPLEVIAKLKKIGIDKKLISKVIYKPGNHQYFVRTKDYQEVHLHASSLEILNQGTRYSTFFIMLHEGSLFGVWVRESIFFLSGLGLLFLLISGFYLWIRPIQLKRKIKQKKEG